MRVCNGTYNATVWRASSYLPPTQVICELYEDPRDGREYQRWQGYLETYWGTADLYGLALTLGAYILELDDGSKGLIYTTYWRGGYAGARWAQFVGPGPTVFENAWRVGNSISGTKG